MRSPHLSQRIAPDVMMLLQKGAARNEVPTRVAVEYALKIWAALDYIRPMEFRSAAVERLTTAKKSKA